jgi:hypothetical protein
MVAKPLLGGIAERGIEFKEPLGVDFADGSNEAPLISLC